MHHDEFGHGVRADDQSIPNLEQLLVDFKDQTDALSKLRHEVDGECYFNEATPVFVIKHQDTRSLRSILAHFKQRALFRVIDSHFQLAAFEHGTDRALLDTLDLRKYNTPVGADICDLEKNALKSGIDPKDILSAADDRLILEGERPYNGGGYGIPADRTTILVYDKSELIAFDVRNEGYRFRNSSRKRQALIGAIEFKLDPQPFEFQLHSLKWESRFELIRNEIFDGLKEKSDLSKAPYLHWHLIGLLLEEYETNGSGTEKTKRVESLVERLRYEKWVIVRYGNLNDQITSARHALEQNDKEKLERMRKAPAFVVSEINKIFAESFTTLTPRHRTWFGDLLDDAEKCQEEVNRALSNSG